MKDFIRKMFNTRNRVKSIGIICGVVAIIVLLVLVIVNPFGNSDAKHKKQLEVRLKELGKDFYANHYYEKTGHDEEQRKTFVKDYAQTGIKIDLANLARIKTEEDEILKEFDGCSEKGTKITIFPKEPYTANDFKIEVSLDCDFSKSTYSKKDNKKAETTTTTKDTTKSTTKKKK